MSEQQIPKKMKKKKNLKEEDKEKCDNYYSEVKLFIDKNDTAISRKLKNLDYFFEYGKKEDLFISDKYDQSLETYGYYNKTQKKMYLSIEEAFYLNQICLINFKPEFNFNDLNLVDLYLYSYLRRAAKIILVGKILLLSYELNQKDEEKDIKNKIYEINDIDKYYILFENKQDYKDHKIKSILYQHDSEQNLNYLLFQNIINNSKKLYNLYLEVNNKKYDEFKAEIIFCITQGVSITFLKLNDTIII